MSKTSESKASKKSEKKKSKEPKRVVGQNSGPRGFLVEHGEKVAFSAFGLLVLLCAFGALRHEPYTKTPEQLSSSLQQKRQAVNENTPDAFTPLKTVEVLPYFKLAGESTALVPIEASYDLESTRSPWSPQPKRGDVEYLTVTNLHTYPVSEALAMLPAGAKKAAPAKKTEPAAKTVKAPPGRKNSPLMMGKGKKPVMPKEPGVGPATKVAKVADGMGDGAAAWAPVRGGVDAPNAEAKAFAGVLVVGTIPQKKQADLFKAKFQGARDYSPGRDSPHCVTFKIQRRKDGGPWEETVTVQTAKGPKEMTFLEAYLHISEKFAMDFPEIVEPQYIVHLTMPEKKADEKKIEERKTEEKKTDDGPITSPGFACPLPPILGRDWDENVAGGFPLHKAEGQFRAAAGPGAGRPAGPQSGRSGGQPGENPSGMPQPVRPGGKAQPGGGPGMVGPGAAAGPGAAGGPGAAKAGPMGPVGGIAGQLSRPGSGPGGLPGAGPGVGGKPGMNNPAQKPQVGMAGGAGDQNQDAGTNDLLFRFFDFTAEEGPTYQYRVALVLENPNLGLTAGLLKDVKLSEGKYRESPFSEPTEPLKISIAGGDVVAGAVRAARVEAGAADSATVIVRQRHRQNGALVAHMFSRLEAGQVLNFKALGVKYEKAVGGVETTPLPEFDFQTDETILDLKGSGDRGWPGEVLLLDANGRLHVSSEVPHTEGPPHFAHESKRLEYIYNYTPPTTARPAGGGDPFGGFKPGGDLLKGMK